MSDVAVDLVAYQKQIVFSRQVGDLFQNFSRVNHAGWVVGVDDQNSGDGRIVFDFIFQVFQIGQPIFLRQKIVSDMRRTAMRGFGGRVSGVSGRWADDAGFFPQISVNFGNGVAQAVEETDVVGADFRPIFGVAFIGQKLPCSEKPFGRVVGESFVVIYRFFNDILNPFGYLIALGHRIADIFPTNFLAQTFYFFGNINNPAYLVG